MKDQKKEFMSLTDNHVRYGAVGLLLILCVSIIAGYYWGKKRAYEELMALCRADSFSDKIAASLCSLYDAADEHDAEHEASEQLGVTELLPQISKVEAQGAVNISQPQDTQYFAELVGFGVINQAKNYAKRLEKRNIKSFVIERKSRTARGKTRIWYQVITAPMGYDELQNLVDRIKVEDHLHGVTLVEFSHKHKERFERAF